MKPPEREQVSDTAAAHPDDVLLQQQPRHVMHAGHREQIQVRDIDARSTPGLGKLCLKKPLIAPGSTDMTQSRCTTRNTGQFNGVKQQRVEEELRPYPPTQVA